MNFTLSPSVRKNIATDFLNKNDVNFDCIIKYSDDSIASKHNILVLFECGFSDLQVIKSLLYHNIMNFIQNSYWTAVQKINLLFGLATQKHLFYEPDFKIFQDASQSHKIRFNSKTNRTDLIAEVFAKLGMNAHSNRTTPVQQTIEELVMNAQLNAPRISTVTNVADSILIVEKSDKLIAVSVIDHYGTFDSKKFLKKIESSLTLGRGEAINFSRAGGAGLGGSVVYGHCDMLLMGCLRLKVTRVTSVLPYNISEKNFSYIQKSISIID